MKVYTMKVYPPIAVCVLGYILFPKVEPKPAPKPEPKRRIQKPAESSEEEENAEEEEEEEEPKGRKGRSQNNTDQPEVKKDMKRAKPKEQVKSS